MSAHGISLQVYFNITDIAKINIGKQWKEQEKQIYILFQVENEKTWGSIFTFVIILMIHVHLLIIILYVCAKDNVIICDIDIEKITY